MHSNSRSIFSPFVSIKTNQNSNEKTDWNVKFRNRNSSFSMESNDNSKMYFASFMDIVK